MGKYVAKVNKTSASYGDWSWDYIKQNCTKKYYDEARIDVDLERDGEQWAIQVPIIDLVDVYLVKKRYAWKWSDDKTLHRWLYEYIKASGEEVSGFVDVRLHTGALGYDKPLVDGYYLQSEIGDDNIVLTTEKKTHKIKKYSDYEWLRLRFLSINQ